MNTLELVEYVRELGSLPDGRFSDDELIRLADGEITDIYNQIISVRSDYMVETVNLTGSQFRIPSRAVGQKVRDITAKQGENMVNIPRVDLSDLSMDPVGYYYKGNMVIMNNVFAQLPQATYEVSYYARPGMLVNVSSSVQCTAVSATGSSWSGAPLTGTSYDVIKGTSGYETMSASLSVTTGTQVGTSYPYTNTVSTVIGGLEVGDWLSVPNTSPIPQFPEEFHTALASLVVARALDSIGDNEGFARATAQAKKQLDSCINMIAERDDGQPEKFRLDTYSPWIYNARRWR